jgi:aspartyl-tRNA(Asn)/glutamyl-tRNA(Gln) amidotransferase subunit A
MPSRPVWTIAGFWPPPTQPCTNLKDTKRHCGQLPMLRRRDLCRVLLPSYCRRAEVRHKHFGIDIQSMAVSNRNIRPMNDREHFASLSIVELVDAYKRKALSPVEVITAQLRRIVDFGGRINAFLSVEHDHALAAARESEDRYFRGQPLGPLDGVSFSTKGSLSIAGRPFRRGSKATSEVPAAITSPAPARCLECGAVFVGTTTMPDFGVGPITVSSLTGVTTNPWDTSKHAGGSSGGAAASVAAGFNTFSLGTDAGGSIRIPAALTGTVGFKASGGRVPSFPVSNAGNLSCPGPITNSVRDVATLMNAIAKHDARDINALPPDKTDYDAELADGIRGVRFAYSSTLGFAKFVDPEVMACTRAAAEWIPNLGATVDEVDPEIADPVGWYVDLLNAGTQHALRHLTDAQKAMLSPLVRSIVDGPQVSLQSYLQAQDRAREIALAMVRFHERFDLLLTPTVAAPPFDASRLCPPEFDQFENVRAWTPFASIFNLTQQPAISIPVGLTASGLPIGLQVVGRRFEDALVLRAANAIHHQWHLPRRPLIVATKHHAAVHS